jgi:hypothetical protein
MQGKQAKMVSPLQERAMVTDATRQVAEVLLERTPVTSQPPWTRSV